MLMYLKPIILGKCITPFCALPCWINAKERSQNETQIAISPQQWNCFLITLLFEWHHAETKQALRLQTEVCFVRNSAVDGPALLPGYKKGRSGAELFDSALKMSVKLLMMALELPLQLF